MISAGWDLGGYCHRQRWGENTLGIAWRQNHVIPGNFSHITKSSWDWCTLTVRELYSASPPQDTIDSYHIKNVIYNYCVAQTWKILNCPSPLGCFYLVIIFWFLLWFSADEPHKHLNSPTTELAHFLQLLFSLLWNLHLVATVSIIFHGLLTPAAVVLHS